MPVALNIRDDIKRATRRLTDIEKRQIPFATAGAINDTLFDVRKQIVGVTGPRSFDLRNRRFLGVAMRMEFASKRTLKGAVFDRLGRASLALHARGGTKRPRGQHIAIPSRELEGKRTIGGAIRKALRPRQVLSKAGRRQAFRVTFRSGQEAIVRRKGKKPSPLQVLYLLERGWSKQVLRASLSFFFLLNMSTGVVGYGVAGLYTKERVALIAIVAVPVLAGFWLGSVLLGRLDERTFRRGVIAIIIFTSTTILARELLGLA